MREHVWVRHYATRRKVAGSIPDEVPGIFLRGKWRPALKADNLTAICEPIV
jgi:hypothetical protein